MNPLKSLTAETPEYSVGQAERELGMVGVRLVDTGNGVKITIDGHDVLLFEVEDGHVSCKALNTHLCRDDMSGSFGGGKRLLSMGGELFYCRPENL